ncbi:MAG TPA: PaaI family thioesterase [Phenylobacterium sp.]|uniref:PaaI family thioesterase n=1 Tax=Phenylobacterium sp. TaxID=1871053 RepID=UPI002B494A5D|nr:PaaI family thioesterase [Phenylobacterium sp.]HKR86944.1 PaaI family thioesterase [Phenylobacterium sp.]
MTTEEAIPAPPAGFVRLDGKASFTTHNGPLFQRTPEGEATGVEQALYILPRHTNTLGVLHGGMLSSFLDGLLGGAVRRGSGRTGVTIHLSVDFLRMARKGEWLMGESRMTHLTRDVAFAEARAWVGRSDVGRATGVFKLMDR